ncbi:uncharacterized protein LOC135494186 isoform X2 [Lineus longissimus]|uniref:uncharacterized protein LOC135494186 isoform X2 n=1 Tax=Lineus longissimus TaxID=88925 RepID=UPI00315DBEB6
MDDIEEREQRATELNLRLQNQMDSAYLEDIKTYMSAFIPPAELDRIRSFSNLCRCLTQKGKISPTNHNYLIRMFEEVGNRQDLRELVQQFDRAENRQPGVLIPLTCLYNKDQILPITERLPEFLGLLDKFLEEHSDFIPQQLFYNNAAAGIARPDRDISLEIGGDQVVVSIPKGAVTENKIIYCHFVDGETPCLLESGQSLVCYSIPVFLGPTGEEFNSHPVVLNIAHNIVPTPQYVTAAIKFYVRREGDELVWKEGEGHFCSIGKDKAMIHLRHFSEFVLAVDPSVSTTLPPFRARMITIIRDISETERSLVIIIVFDSAYMIKKVKQMLRGRKCMVGVTTSQEVILEPRVASKIKVQGRRWTGKDDVQDVTPDQLDMLVFKPVYREITMVQEENTNIQDSRMCSLAIIQNNQSQKFVVDEDTFKLRKATEDEVITPEYAESRTEFVAPETSATITNYLFNELDRQRKDFKESIDAVQKYHREREDCHREETFALIEALKENFKQQRTEQQKQIKMLQAILVGKKKVHQKKTLRRRRPSPPPLDKMSDPSFIVTMV